MQRHGTTSRPLQQTLEARRAELAHLRAEAQRQRREQALRSRRETSLGLRVPLSPSEEGTIDGPPVFPPVRPVPLPRTRRRPPRTPPMPLPRTRRPRTPPVPAPRRFVPPEARPPVVTVPRPAAVHQKARAARRLRFWRDVVRRLRERETREVVGRRLNSGQLYIGLLKALRALRGQETEEFVSDVLRENLERTLNLLTRDRRMRVREDIEGMRFLPPIPAEAPPPPVPDEEEEEEEDVLVPETPTASTPSPRPYESPIAESPASEWESPEEMSPPVKSPPQPPPSPPEPGDDGGSELSPPTPGSPYHMEGVADRQPGMVADPTRWSAGMVRVTRDGRFRQIRWRYILTNPLPLMLRYYRRHTVCDGVESMINLCGMQ